MKKPSIETIAANLKRFRAEEGLTRAELAKKSGIPVSSVRALETCKDAKPDPRILCALASALNRTISDLITEPLRLERVRICFANDDYC